ncbi:MAG: hypothetical protein [Caudoviricetes sp.]|nr:MAG: hypothetical protein [Caudoviricetes sp.]
MSELIKPSRGPRIPPMHSANNVNIVVNNHNSNDTQELLSVISPTYQVRNTVKTWYAILHIAGNIEVAKAFIQKRILNDDACYQIAAVDYVYSGGCEQGMTIRCIHYPRFPRNNPEILLEKLMLLANDLATELGQKSYTIETSENTVFFDNGNKQ